MDFETLAIFGQWLCLGGLFSVAAFALREHFRLLTELTTELQKLKRSKND